MRALGPAIDDVLRGVAEAVPGDRYREWVETMARWYRPDTRFGEAFCRLLPHMLGPYSPLMLDAMHPALKEAQRPWLRRLVERRREVEDALALRDAEVKARGYSLQVSPQRGLSPLFLLRRGERRRIEWRGEDGFTLRGRPGEPESVDVLFETIEENPGVVSPGVLARPAVQDAVLGTTLQVLGPGELSYMAQASATHAVLEVEPPWVALRPQTLVLEPKKVERLLELGLPLATLLGGRSGIDHWLAEREGGDLTGPVRQRLEEALAGLRGPALEADPGLERPFEKTREQILRALDLFGEKAVAAAARKNEVVNRRVQQLREACLPLGKPQERIISSAHFPGKYGAGLRRELLGADGARRRAPAGDRAWRRQGMTRLDVLAVGAHPDDVELGCGGTLALLARQGRKVGILHLTRGEQGTRGTAEERRAEAEAAARALGAVEMDFLDCGDGGLRTGPAEEDALIAKLRSWRPELVLGPTPRDRHPDHGRGHELVAAACFYAGLRNRAPGAGEAHRPAAVFSYMQHDLFTPSFIVDVSSVWETKIESLRAYRSQLNVGGQGEQGDKDGKRGDQPMTKVASPEFWLAVEGRARHFGLLINAALGEPFWSRGPLAAADPMSLLPGGMR